MQYTAVCIPGAGYLDRGGSISMQVPENISTFGRWNSFPLSELNSNRVHAHCWRLLPCSTRIQEDVAQTRGMSSWRCNE